MRDRDRKIQIPQLGRTYVRYLSPDRGGEGLTQMPPCVQGKADQQEKKERIPPPTKNTNELSYKHFGGGLKYRDRVLRTKKPFQRVEEECEARKKSTNEQKKKTAEKQNPHTSWALRQVRSSPHTHDQIKALFTQQRLPQW